MGSDEKGKKVFIFGPPQEELYRLSENISNKLDAELIVCSEVAENPVLKEGEITNLDKTKDYVICGFFNDKNLLFKTIFLSNATHIINFVEGENASLSNLTKEAVKKYKEMVESEPYIFDKFDSMKIPSIVTELNPNSLGLVLSFIKQKEYSFFCEEEEYSDIEMHNKDEYSAMRKELEQLLNQN